MTEAPLRMECYDVSHLCGTNIVASMVVFEDGLPRKDQYRRFGIPASTDDTESIYQMLTRTAGLPRHRPRQRSRAELDSADASNGADGRDAAATESERPRSAAERFAYRPNLLIVDGGQPQVAAAARALADAGVTGITLCGIAKRLEEIWLPDTDFPVILPRNSDALFLIQRIRDEAHRFAITYQRQKRRKDIGSCWPRSPGRAGPGAGAAAALRLGRPAPARGCGGDRAGARDRPAVSPRSSCVSTPTTRVRPPSPRSPPIDRLVPQHPTEGAQRA